MACRPLEAAEEGLVRCVAGLTIGHESGMTTALDDCRKRQSIALPASKRSRIGAEFGLYEDEATKMGGKLYPK